MDINMRRILYLIINIKVECIVSKPTKENLTWPRKRRKEKSKQTNKQKSEKKKH